MLLTGCASTSSIVLPVSAMKSPMVAIMPLEGPLGDQASDLIAQALAEKGVGVVERAKVVNTIRVDTLGTGSAVGSTKAMSSYAQALGVRYLFSGTVSAEKGPLYSFDHVNMTLRLVDAETGQTRWIGRYGNSFWTSSISTQGDLQRGAKSIVSEFIKAGGPKLMLVVKV
jgi:TolB-like protein